MSVTFPYMRRDVLETLRVLADPHYQQTVWGRKDPDNFSLAVHTLYDDTRVLPVPSAMVGDVVYEWEVQPLLRLGEILDDLIDLHGDAPDEVYLADSRWSEVVRVSSLALAAMTSHVDEE